MKQFITNWSRGSGGTERPLRWLRSLALTAALALGSFSGFAQTTLLSPSGDGGFENGTTLTANGWTGVPSVQTWFVGTPGGVTAGTNAAYTSTTSGSWTPGTAGSVAHMYRDIFVPATEPLITITLKYKILATDPTYDYIKVHCVSTSTVPTAGTMLGTGQYGANTDGTTSFATYTFSGVASNPGGLNRFVISFRQDGFLPYGAAAVDEISITSAPPTPATCATSFTPANNTTNVALPATLTWSGANGNPVNTYDVYLSTNSALVAAKDASVRVATGISATTFNPTGLALNTTYYWMVLPGNGILGSVTSCTVNQFTTIAAQTYTATAQGGLWSSPGTWVGGAVPPSGVGHSISIPSGSVVTVDQTISYANYSINGIMQWNATTPSATVNTMNASGTVTIGATGRFYPYSTGGSGATVFCLGDFINNGYANLYLTSMNFTGSGTQTFGGAGTYQGNGTKPTIGTITKQNTGTLNVGFACNVRTINPLNGTINATNVEMDFTKSQIWAESIFTGKVSQAVVTAMGAGYTTPPVVAPSGATLWAASSLVSLGNVRVSGNNVYVVTTAGTTGTVAPSHTSATAPNGTATLLWVGNTGSVGNAFILAATAGTQYFYGNNLYTCTVAGTASAAAPPTHTSGIAVSGTATYQYVGPAAKISLNYDATNQVVRSASITTAGAGYIGSPANIILASPAPTTTATLSVIAYHSFSVAATGNALVQKSGAANFSGSPTIIADGRLGVPVTGNGGRYATAPSIGVSAPNAISLAQLPGFSGGAGYTVAPTAAFTGGTLVSGTSALTPIVAGGKIIGITLGTGIYSVPPTGITFTGGTFTTAASTDATFTTELANRWAQYTATLGTNGQINGFTVLNAGSDYVTATLALSTAAAGEIGATLPTVKAALYNLSLANYTPTAAPTGVDWATPATPGVTPHNENTNLAGFIPASRKMNVLAMGAGVGFLTLNGNLTLIGSAPFTLGGGPIDMSGNTFTFQHPGYLGANSSGVCWVFNGSLVNNYAAAATGNRLFPFRATGASGALQINPGTGTLAAGSDITRIRVSQLGAPSGAVSGGGSMTGQRSFQVDFLNGSTFGTSPTVLLAYDGLDQLVSDNQSLFLCQSTTGITGGWSVRSTAGVAGTLAATGTRTSATAAPGPVVFAATTYFGWSTSYTPISGLNYAVTRTTGNPYNSIMPTTLGGDGTGIAYTSAPGWATTSTDDGITNIVSIPSSTFTYQGSVVTGFRACTNGNLQLQNANAAPNSNAWSNQLSLTTNLVAPFWDDLTTNPNSGGNTTLDASMRYFITASAPGTRQIIAEWYKMTQFGNAGPELYFQVVLDETDNSIKFNYGNMQLFNGTANLRYSYTTGLAGGFISPYPQQGEIMALQYENSTAFSQHNAHVLANLGANAMFMSPEPRSSYQFTPGTYTAPTPFAPVVSAPANDEPATAVTLPALLAFPSNIAWNSTTNSSNYYTLRAATQSPQAICGGPSNAKDVWFKFVANDPNMQIRVYPSGGMTPVMEILTPSLTPLSPAQCNVGTVEGTSALTTTLSGLAVGSAYYVRVYNSKTGNTAQVNLLTSGGNVISTQLVTGGNNYPTLTTNPGPLLRITGGGGNGCVLSVSNTAGVINATLQTGGGGIGYSSNPTATFDSPDWGYTGEFGIIVFAAAPNDDPATATTLTNLSNATCVNGQNAKNQVYTGSASASGIFTCAGTADDDVWYKFQAENTGFTNITVTGYSTFNPAVQVFDNGANSTYGTPAQVACWDLTGAGGVEGTILPTTAGNWYFVRVYHSGVGSGTFSPFDICVQTFTPPAGFWCPTAINVPLASIPYSSGTVNTSIMGDQYGLQTSSCSSAYGGGNDVVYKLDLSALTVPVQLNINLVNTSGTFNIGWFLKSSTDCDNTANTIDCAVSGSSANAAVKDVIFDTPGIYYLVVDYAGGVISSNYTLDITYSCPTVLGLALGSVSPTTADLTWASQNVYASYNLQYKLVSSPTWTNWSGNPLASNTVTLTGLTAASSYQYRVSAICNGPATAPQSTAFAFNTLCNTFAAPLTQNFNTGVLIPSLPVCWTKLVSGLTGAANVTTTTSGLPVSGNQVAMYNGLNSSPSGQVLLVSPQLTDINQPLAPNRLTFSARAATVPVVTNANACTSSTTQYPSTTTTPTGNTLTTISTCSYTVEYSVVSLTQDSAYQIAISGNAYMSITNGTGTVVYQTGQSPQTFVAPATGNYRCYWSDGLSPSCGGTSSCFTTTIQKVTPPETGSTSSLVVGTLADPTDANTFTPKANIDINGTHTTYTVDFFDYLGTNQYIGIKHGESTLGTNKTIYIDNIGWNPIPPCTTPLGLAVSNITVGSATFAWNPVFDALNGYSVQYQVAGDLTWTDVPGSPIAFGTNSVVVNVLDPGTIYSWRVAAICGSGNSGYSNGTTFTTLCNPVGVPYTEGFESILSNNQMPNCISTTNLGTRTYTYTAPITGGAARSGTDYAVILSGNTAPGDFIFTPALNLSGGTAYQLRFWFRRDGFSGASNTLTAWYGTSATAVAMTNAVGSSVNLNTAGTAGTYQSFTATFTPATDGVYYVGIRRFASSPSTGVLSIDDISIDLPSTCPDPSGVAVSGVPTTSSIGINWSENGTATQWDVEYGVSPYTFTGVPNVTGTSSKPYTITGLLPNTQYDIRVRSRCSASNLSDWSTVATLRTACGTISSFPWSYGFEDVTTLNTLVNCDAAYPATLAQGLGLSVYPNVSTATGTLYNRGPRTGNGFAAHYYTQGNSADSSVYFTPRFQLTAGTNYRFAMYYRSDGAGPFPRLACYYGPNQSTVGMLPIPGARVNNSANTAYALLEGYFTPATSGTYSIGVSSVYAPIPWYLSFDDMSLSVVPCLPPSAFSASVGTNSVTWSATNPVSGFTPTNYQIEMNTTGVFTGTPGITLTPTNTALGAVNTLVTGSLTPGTRYYYQYRGNCGGTQTTWVSGSFVTKPVNDDCAAAITVTPSTSILCSSTTSGSTLGGTASLGTAVNASTQCTPLQSNPDDDVWYKFVATAIQHVVTVSGSTGFDAVVEVRNSASGACPGTTPAVACANLSSEGGVETVTLSTVIGNTYYVRVWSGTTNAQTTNPVSGLPVTYGFSLCVSTPSTGPGATCATAISAGIFDTPWYSTYTTQGSDDNIGLQGSCSGTYGNGEDIVYRLSVMTPGVRTIKVTNLNGTGYIGWFLKNANNCANTLEDSTLSCAVSGNGNVAAGYYNLNPGVYYLVIDYDAILGPAYSNYRLDINKVPFNDEYTGAPAITPGISCTPTSGSVNNATPSAGVPANFSCIGDPNDDVWYRFTASAANHLITLSGNSYVDRIEVFSQVLVGSTLTLNSLSCASAASGTAQINLSGLTVGTTYYLRVYSSTSQPTLNPVLNNFSVCVQTPPSNDDICSAQILTVSAFATYVTGNNSVATDGATIGGSCANFGSNFFKDVWYRVQAPSDGVLAVSILAGSYADHDLQVWSTNNQSNPCAGTLTSVACDLSSGVGSEPYLYLTGLTSGNWYLLQVRSNASGQGGTFQIAATNAVNWTGASNTVYESPGNWFNGDAAPTLGMNIAIPVTANKPVVSSNPTLNNLYMANGAVLTLNLNTIYKVRNNITVSGSGSASINGEGRLQFTQNAATQTITGTLNAGSVELAKSAGTSVSFAANSFLKVYNVFTPTSGTINTTNNLILASDAASTNGTGLYSTSGQAVVGTATINGPVLVQRYVKKLTNYPEYHYVSSPVSGNATVSANYSDNTWITGDAGYAYTSDPFAPQPAQFPNAWWYDESINSTNAAFGWVSATGPVAMNPGRGIAIQFNASTILDVSGSLNTGNISRAISYTDNGFNLIGNPYPQPISWNTFYSANNTKIAQGLSLWNAGANNYATFNGTTWVNNTGAGNNDKIAHSQAFFVTALPGQTSVNFTDGMRSASNAYTFFGSPENLIRLQVDNGGYSDESVIYFNENASNGYDGGYDARKLIPAMVNRPSLYSMSEDNTELAINVLSSYREDLVIPLGVITGESGKVEIRATDLSKLDAFIEVYLEDAVSGKVVNLRDQSYSVNLSQGNAGSRFFLRFKKEAPAVAAAAVSQPGEFNIYGNDNRVFVNIPVEAKGDVRIEVMNVLGQEMAVMNVSNAGGLKELSVANAVAGNYLVKVVNGGKVYTQKVYLSSK